MIIKFQHQQQSTRTTSTRSIGYKYRSAQAIKNEGFSNFSPSSALGQLARVYQSDFVQRNKESSNDNNASQRRNNVKRKLVDKIEWNEQQIGQQQQQTTHNNNIDPEA